MKDIYGVGLPPSLNIRVVQNNTYDLLETVLKGLNFYSSLTGLGKTSDFGEDFNWLIMLLYLRYNTFSDQRNYVC